MKRKREWILSGTISYILNVIKSPLAPLSNNHCTAKTILDPLKKSPFSTSYPPRLSLSLDGRVSSDTRMRVDVAASDRVGRWSALLSLFGLMPASTMDDSKENRGGTENVEMESALRKNG